MQRTRIAESELYFNILKEIFKGSNYNQSLAPKLKMEPSSLIDHLKYLEEKGLLNATREKKNNKKIYSLNYEGLALLFAKDLQFCLLSQLRTPTIKYHPEGTKEEISEHVKHLAKVIKGSTSAPSIVQGTFILLFGFSNERYENVKDLRELFAVTFAFLTYMAFNKEAKEQKEQWGREFKDTLTLFNALEGLKGFFVGELRSNYPYLKDFNKILSFMGEKKA